MCTKRYLVFTAFFINNFWSNVKPCYLILQNKFFEKRTNQDNSNAITYYFYYDVCDILISYFFSIFILVNNICTSNERNNMNRREYHKAKQSFLH